MHELFIAGLNRALKGDAAARAGFGLVRTLRAPSGAEDILAVDGAGVLSRRISRSLSDQPGLPVGAFESPLGAADLEAVMKLARELVRLPARAAAKARGNRVLLEMVAGGELFAEEESASEGAAPYLEPLLRLLLKLQAHATAQPLRALTVSLALPAAAAGEPLRAVLRLRNPGRQGTWIVHPHAAGAAVLLLSPGKRDKQEPPAAPIELALSAPPSVEGGEAPPFLWLAAGAEAEVQLVAALAPPPEPLVARLRLESKSAADLAGRPLLQGTAFSNDLPIESRR